MGFLILLIVRRITNTWAFMRQSFSVVRSYRPLMLLPPISCVFCLLVSIIVLGGGVLVFDIPIHAAQFAPETPRVSAEGIRQLTLEAFGFEDHKKTGLRKTNAERRMTEREWLTMFFFYLANYAVITYFNVAFASIVLDHLAGGHATLNDGLQTAWLRKRSILQWAILAATVGILLKMLSKRSQIGRWIASILGYTWKLSPGPATASNARKSWKKGSWKKLPGNPQPTSGENRVAVYPAAAAFCPIITASCI